MSRDSQRGQGLCFYYAPGYFGQMNISARCEGTGVENVQLTLGNETFTCSRSPVPIVVDRDVGNDIPGSGVMFIRAVSGEDTHVTWFLTGKAEP